MSYNSNIEKTRTDTNLRIETQDRNLDLKELQNELGCKGWKRQLRMRPSGWAPLVTLVEFPWSISLLMEDYGECWLYSFNYQECLFLSVSNVIMGMGHQMTFRHAIYTQLDNPNSLCSIFNSQTLLFQMFYFSRRALLCNRLYNYSYIDYRWCSEIWSLKQACSLLVKRSQTSAHAIEWHFKDVFPICRH